MKKQKQILITGASKFIGKSLARYLRSDKRYCVHTPNHCELNLTDSSVVNSYFKGKYFDCVIHCATKNEGDVNIIRDNVLMFHNINNNRKNVGKIIFMSSGAVYGRHVPVKMAEEESVKSLQPINEYGISKYTIEKMLSNKDVSLRLFSVYGNDEDHKRRFISKSICRTIYKLPIVINRERFVDFVHIDDVCEIVKHCIDTKTKNKIYNVCNYEPCSLSEIANEISEEFKEDIPIILLDKSLGFEYSGKNEKILKEMPKNFRFKKISERIPSMIDSLAKKIGRGEIKFEDIMM